MFPLPIRLVPAKLGLALLASGFLASGARAQSLETFVMTVGGNSGGPGGCQTYTTPDPVLANFGAFGPSLPLAGLAPCGVAGDLRSSTSLAGPVFDAMQVMATWNPPVPITFVGDAHALATYGDLAVRAHGDMIATSGDGSTLVAGAEALAISTDGFTITSASVANGQVGFLRVYVTVTGALSTTGNGMADVDLVYRVNSGPTFTFFRAQAFGLALPFVTSATGNGLAGFVRTPGAMSGSGVIDTFAIPFFFGTPFDFRLGLLAYGVPGTMNVTLDGEFRARISHLQVYRSSGQPLGDAVVSSAAGAHYGWLPSRGFGTAGAPRGFVTRHAATARGR